MIQKLFRNHVDYKKFCNIKNNFYEEKQLKFYNYLVLQIQRCFRGYYSRKYKSDMKKRKKYIQELQEKNDELIRSMSAYAEKQLEEDYLYQKKLKEEKFFKLAQNLHHLTSTKQIPGVYNPNPYLMNVCYYYLFFYLIFYIYLIFFFIFIRFQLLIIYQLKNILEEQFEIY